MSVDSAEGYKLRHEEKMTVKLKKMATIPLKEEEEEEENIENKVIAVMTWTRQEDWTSAWLRGGEIAQAVWVDKQVLAWSSGVHLVFYDLSTSTQTLYSPNLSEADGVCCLAAKPALQLLAFAERKSIPGILIYQYPQMKLVAKCNYNQLEPTEFAYLSIAFAKDYLVSSTSSSLIVWSWRTGEKFIETETSFEDLENQMIRVAETHPISLAHLGGRLIVWKLFSSLVITKEEIVFPSEALPVYVDWSSDVEAQLAIVDRHGHIYIKNTEGITRVVLSQRCGVCLEYEVPSVCWFLDGLMLKTTFCQMRFYKKNEKNIWRRQHYVKSDHKPRFFLPHPVEKEKLFYFTTEGSLMQLQINHQITNELKFHYGGVYQFADLVYPWGDHVAAIEGSRLSIISIADGNQVGILDFASGVKVSGLKSHLDYPLLAITFDSGELYLTAVHQPDRPVLLFKFHLQRRKLDLAKFSACGRHLVAAGASGDCFCVSSDQSLFSKVDHLKIKKSVIDVNCCVSEGVIKIIAIVLTSHKSGQLLVVYRVPEVFERVIELPRAYQSLDFTGNGLKMVGTPYLSKEIHFFNFQATGLSLTDCSAIYHQLRHLQLASNRFCITAAGSDGLITILSGDSRVTLLSHHRKDLGVSRAICSVSKDLVIALGRNGSLVCLKTTVRGSKHSRSFYNYLSVRPIHQMLSQEYQVVPSDAKSGTWLEWSQQTNNVMELEDWREERLQIKNELKKFKDKIKEMLDLNEEAEEIYRLPVADFDIARFVREQKIKAAKEKREDVKLQREFEGTEMNKVVRWIAERFENVQRVKAKTLCSFSDNCTYSVMNYLSMEDPLSPEGEGVLLWIDELRSSVKMDVNMRINSVGRESKVYSLVKSRYKSRDEKSVIESLMIDDDEEDEEVRLEEERTSTGTTTCRFIQTYFQHSQFENLSFGEFYRVNQRLLKDIRSLEDYFNEMFEEIWENRREKVNEIEGIKEKLKFISEEMEEVFGKKLSGELLELKGNLELGEEESELGDDGRCAKDVSEKNRLADEFREKTIAMMDGVEVRWEDLKKEIPILENFEGFERDVVEKHEKEVYALNFLKEKYRRVLESDFQKSYKVMQEMVGDFDKRFKDFLIVKIKIDSAIQQINLLRVRGMIRFVERFQMMEKIGKVEGLIVEKQERGRRILEIDSKMRKLVWKLKEERGALEEERAEFWNKTRKELVGKFGKEVFEEMKKGLKEKFAEMEFISPEQRNCFVGLKRKKAEIELRLRVNSIELSEIEKGVGDNKIKVRQLEADVGELEEQVRRLKERLIEFDIDIEIQLVIEKRQVDINLCGGREDAENCNLMPREQVERVIKEVIVAAEDKLRVLLKVMAFNRILVMKEWKHEALKKEMLDFADELQDVKTFVVTNDSRVVLEKKSKDKTPQKLAREVNCRKIAHEKILRQASARVQVVEEKIRSVKRENEILGRKILKTNENFEAFGDLGTKKSECSRNFLMKVLMKRSEIMRSIMREFQELEELKNEYRVQCQRTIPFFGLIKD
ncbi:hypothetical protein KQX54_004699 [Cotesia glomerata]|uniref:Cilia- and flagella-associated protein 43 n=1 Tax=Cotesia glomerata TaxID=32391 RepID=A0AAV7I0S6_COTGL|nr:hypothetical protein KQX54_004699 [Cotesia glomerata]